MDVWHWTVLGLVEGERSLTRIAPEEGFFTLGLRILFACPVRLDVRVSKIDGVWIRRFIELNSGYFSLLLGLIVHLIILFKE